ncbi:MAG: hypothetical protein ACI9XB_005213 [Gammaproteobacteria bacterium]|jgi:hypothetical protein
MKFYSKVFILVMVLFSLASNNVIGQELGVIIFKTFEDYKDGNGRLYEGDFKLGSFGSSPGISNRHLTLRNKDIRTTGNKRVKIKLKTVWGFSLNGLLFRVDKSTSYPHYLFYKGDFCYYENGIAILKMVKSKGKLEENLFSYIDDSDWGGATFFSKSIDSKMYKFSSKRGAGKVVDKFPEYQELFDCIFPTERKNLIKKTRDCVVTYK